MKPSESNSLVYSIEQFSILMPLHCLLYFSGLMLECQLLIIQSLERFSYISCINQVCNGALSVFFPKLTVGFCSL